MNRILVTITIIAILTIFVYGTISSEVMAKEKAVEPYMCYPHERGFVICCQAFQDGNGPLTNYCTLCRDTNPPSQCTDRFAPKVPIEESTPSIPSTGGV
ncbi:MAG: hypothetical protein ACRD6Q_02245, partial [Nitrososphaeraceae archaeon]